MMSGVWPEAKQAQQLARPAPPAPQAPIQAVQVAGRAAAEAAPTHPSGVSVEAQEAHIPVLFLDEAVHAGQRCVAPGGPAGATSAVLPVRAGCGAVGGGQGIGMGCCLG